MEVHNALHRGYPEVFYQRALVVEFGLQNIKFVREHSIEVHYKSVKIDDRRVDFLAPPSQKSQ